MLVDVGGGFPRIPFENHHSVYGTRFGAPDGYFNLSATFASPALAHASSISHPGAPLTAIAPITSFPSRIAIPPAMSIVPSIGGLGMVPSTSGTDSAVFLDHPSTTSLEGR